MSFNTILVHIDDSGRCKLRLDVAIRLAVDFRAHLIGAYLVPTAEMTPFLATMLPDDFVEQPLASRPDRACKRSHSSVASPRKCKL